MALRLATDIFDFYPDSPDYDQRSYEAMADEARDRIADRNNQLRLDLAQLEADISAMNTATQTDNMDAASSDAMRNDFISGALSLAGGVVSGGADAGWFDKFKMDPIGSQGNPFGSVSADSPILGVPGGASVGGGRVPLNY